MRTPVLFLIAVLNFTFLAAQTDYNPYKDFTQGGNYPDYATERMKNYWGEYQWFIRTDTPDAYVNWVARADSMSWKIEVLSFPFVANQQRTTQNPPHETRILTVPKVYNEAENEWEWYKNPKRVDHGQAPSEVGNTKSGSETINRKTSLMSNYFDTPDSIYTSVERLYLPHSIVRHTVYAHCDESENAVDSLSFIIDLTRGRMRYYPFIDSNFADRAGPRDYDVTIQHRLLNDTSYAQSSNPFGTTVQYPLDTVNTSLCNGLYMPDPQGGDLFDPFVPHQYIRPTPYALSAFDILNHPATLPAGYEKDSGQLVLSEGIEHTYVVDTFIDLTVINPVQKVIYNPSTCVIEADSLVFPTGYTFLTVRAVYADSNEVVNSPHCPMAEELEPNQIVAVPTDLDTAVYTVEGHVILQPCVAIYDAKFIIKTGASLTYTPEEVYGNFVIENNGGTVIELEPTGAYCNNCACIQEYCGGSSITISGSQGWETDRTIGGLVNIPYGATLTIRNAEITFADSDRLGRKVGIRVQPGGKLVLDDAELTVLECDKMWDGVEIWGSRTLTQTDGNQGTLEMKNSLIEHARVGIKVGEYEPCPDTARGGGILTIDSSTFRNNHKAIVFDPYEGYKNGKRSKSDIRNTDFISDDLLRDQEAFLGIGTERFVELRLINGAKFFGNRFENFTEIHDTLKPIGILTHDASIIVDSADTSGFFKNLLQGIDMYRTRRYVARSIIQHCVFDSVVQGITVRKGASEFIARNEFKNIHPALVYDTINPGNTVVIVESKSRHGWGVYMMDVRLPMVAYNSFDRAPADIPKLDCYGVIVNSAIVGEVDYNDFTDLDIGLQTEYDNRKVRLGCNAHDGNGTAWSINPPYDIDGHTGIGPAKLWDQGEGCFGNEKTAGNTFGTDQCDNGKEILITDSTTFNYYGHGFHSSSTVPDTNCSTLQRIEIEACERIGAENDWCPEIPNPVVDTNPPYPGKTEQELAEMIDTLSTEDEKYWTLSDLVGRFIDRNEHDRALGMLEDITFTETRRDQAWLHLGEGDTTSAFDLADDLAEADSNLHKAFTEFIRFADEYKEYPGHPCEYPKQSSYNWLKTIANSGTETAFGAEAALAAIDDQVLSPTPLQWTDADAKRGYQVPQTEDAPDIWIYPVPAQNVIYVKAGDKGQFLVRDLHGRVVLSVPVHEGTQTIQTSELSAGYYIAILRVTGNHEKRNPIIIAR